MKAMKLDEFYVSHIGMVRVSFSVSALNLDPAEFTSTIGVQPISTAKRGDERRNYVGNIISPHEEGYWKLSSEGKVNSKDINEHFSFLLKILLPHRKEILRLVKELNGEADFDLIWQSSYLHAGTGPLLSLEIVKGVSQLGAAIGFDIYQIKEQKS